MRQPEFSDVSSGLWAPKIQPRIRTQARGTDQLPDKHELLEMLGELSELLGASSCARAYQLYTSEDLPDEWERELVSQRGLIRRLLRYAGKDDRSLPVRVTDSRHARSEELGDHLSGDLAYVGVTGDDQAAANFLVLDLGDFRAMFGPTCVEVARALIHRARIDGKALGYRKDEALDDAGVELPTELEGFLACFALGWGVPVTNACLDSRSVGGGLRGTAWIAASLSYPPEIAAWLLAVIYRAGARSQEFVDSRRAVLNPSQRELFDRASDELELDDQDLRELLRWGHPNDWPAPLDRALAELEYDAHDQALAAADELYAARQRLPNLGGFVFRARPKWTLQGAIVGGLVGVLLGSALGSILGVGVGAFLGSRMHRNVCSGPRCGAPLERDAQQCSACGGTIVGEIPRAKDHLGALEDYERRLAEHEPQIDASHD